MRIFVKTTKPEKVEQLLKTWIPIEVTNEGILVENNQFDAEFPDLNELANTNWVLRVEEPEETNPCLEIFIIFIFTLAVIGALFI